MTGRDIGFPNGPPDIRIDRRDWGDAIDQGAQVQAGATDQDGKAALSLHLGNLGSRQTRPVRGGAGIGAVADAVEPMIRTCPVVLGRRSAEDWQVAIDLRTVGVDDNSACSLGKQKGQCRLAARRRTGDERQWRFLNADGHCHADSSRTAR